MDNDTEPTFEIYVKGEFDRGPLMELTSQQIAAYGDKIVHSRYDSLPYEIERLHRTRLAEDNLTASELDVDAIAAQLDKPADKVRDALRTLMG